MGGSRQYAESVSFARKIVKDIKDNELIFVGHSLGGGEVSADAFATGRDVITFNTAGVSSATKDVLQLDKMAKIDAYRVDGEIVGPAQGLIGLKADCNMHLLGAPPNKVLSTMCYPMLLTMPYLFLLKTKI